MIVTRLFEMQDISYRDFNSSLIPTVDKARIIGVRTPLLRSFARELKGSGEAEFFIKALPHYYFEENNLHAFLTEYIRDIDLCIAELNIFLPCVDNWATCDCMNPKILKKYPEKTLNEVEKWLASGDVFTVRFGIKKLMDIFLDEYFDEKYLTLVASIDSDEYYVKMMKAWYFATALAKQYDKAVVYLKEKRLKPWEHNKTIQKALESYRINGEQKRELKEMRLKV